MFPTSLPSYFVMRCVGDRVYSVGGALARPLSAGKGFNPRVQQLWCKIGSISVLGQIFSPTR